MTKINTHPESLPIVKINGKNQLKELQSIIPQLSKENYITNSNQKKAEKKIQTLSQMIQKLKKYSKHLQSYGQSCQKQTQKNLIQIGKTNQEFVQANEKVLSLEQQSMYLRKKLNQKDKEIQKLKMITPINASFAQSICFQDKSQIENYEQFQKSQASQTILQNLDSYQSISEIDKSQIKNGKTFEKFVLQEHILENKNQIII